MWKIEVVAGMGFDANGGIIYHAERNLALEHITVEVSKLAGGVTFVEMQGSWQDPTGKLVREPAGMWIIYSDRSESEVKEMARQVCAIVKRALRQGVVILTLTPISLQFI